MKEVNKQDVIEQENGEKKTGVKSKVTVIALIVIFILFFVLGMMFSKTNKKLVLDNLIESPYKVVEFVKDEATGDYDVVVESDLENEDVVELSVAIQQAIEKFEKQDSVPVNIYVHDEVNTGENYKENFKQFVEVIREVIVYTLIEMGDLTGEVTITEDWQIYNAKRNGLDLTGEVSLVEGLSVEAIFQQLKGISEEMLRFNEVQDGGYLKFSTKINDNLSYAYDSSYLTTLFSIEKFSIVEVVEK